ncbi:E3 ubiquitin-protein ligase UPL1-like protein, partial [Drosera capensis]
MKMKRKRSPEVDFLVCSRNLKYPHHDVGNSLELVMLPPKIESFIDSVVAVPFECVEEPLKNFVWDYEKGDFHHWVDLFTHFDSYFEKHINPRKDLHIEEDTFLDPDPPFPKEAVLQILRVVRIILENCSNKHFYSSFEQHLSSLLASTDADVVEASLQTLATFLKKTIGKYSIKDASLSTKLFAFSQGWGGKDEGLGLTACALENGCDSIACQLGSTVHFEFYLADESSNDLQSCQGLHVIHLSDINSHSESDLELLHILVKEYRVPPNLRFSLLTRLRFARAFSSLASRQQFTCIRLYAYVVLLQVSGSTDPEPEFINELVSLLSFEDAVPAKIQILALLSLVALSQNRTRQPAVITAVTSGGHREILSSLVQKAVDCVLHNSSKWSVVFAEALLSLITILVSSSVGCAAVREAGFIPTLLPLLKDANTEHLHLVSTAVHVLEAFMDFSNPAAALFRDLGGLDDTVIRLKEEVSIIANGSKQPCEDSSHSRKSHDVTAGSSSALEEMQPLYTDIVISHHRKLLIKAFLRAISLGTYAPGNTNRIYGSEESLLPQCLCVIFRRAKDFGGGVFSLAATVMGDLIHKDPTCYPVLDAAGLPSAFIDAIIDGVVCSAEALACIPQCLDALCLNNGGLQLVKDRNALRCFVKIFTSKMYLHYLSVDTMASLSSGLDELMRHASSLRGPAVEMLIEILSAILRIGSGSDARSSSSASLPCSSPVPMETDGEEKNLPSPVDKMPSIVEVTDLGESSTKASTLIVEYSLPDFVSNAARLLGTVLQNSDVCRMFNEKKGVETVLQMFSLPLLPISASLGPTIYAAFKNFSPQHSPALARGICSFLKEHLKSTNELFDSVGGKPLTKLESAQQIKVLRCLSCVEGVLSLSNSLLKGTSTIASELGVGDSEVLKDIGKTYMEVLWQISLSSDAKVDEKQNVNVEIAPADGSLTSGAARESDDETNVPAVRYVNPVPLRNGSRSLWTAERDILSVIRLGEGLSRRRHGLTRIRAGRSIRYLDHSRIESEPSSSIPETLSSQEQKKKSPDILISELLIKLGSIMRSFYANLVRGFTSQNRRRTDSVSLTSSAKNVGAALAKIYVEALTFSGNSTSSGLDVPLSVKCRYLGKVVNDMSALVYDSRRRVIHSVMVNNFYVSGAFKELLTTFAATSQLLWTVPFPFSMSSAELEMCETSKSAPSSWLLSTLQSYCRVLECFVNSSLLLSPTSSSQNQLLVQPIATGLSIGLFPVPREPEVFIRMLQSQVLDVILPVWNNSMFPNCNPAFITSILSILTCIYSGVGDVKHIRSSLAVNVNQRVAPPPDESTIATIVEMGFSRARAEEALRRIERNSVEMAMEWLFNHPEDPLQEEDELARVLALSLGNSSEAPKPDSVDKSVSVLDGEGLISAPPVDDILATLMKLFQSGDFVAFPLTNFLVTLCNRNKGDDRSKVVEYLVQTLKHCPLDTNAFPAISHILAILLSEDASTREAAAEGGMVSIALDALTNLKMKDDFGSEKLVTKSISTLLLILDNLLQLRPKITSESKEISLTAPLHDSSVEQSSVSPPVENHLDLGNGEKEVDSELEKLLGRPTGYLTLEDGHKVLGIACDLLRLCVPSVIMQAVLQLCARLTKICTFALYFLESGGMMALFGLPRSCLFPGYDVLASTIVRHLLEDPPTLQAAMESEIRQTMSSSRHAGRITTQTFLTSMAPVISRDPVIFMKAAASVCELESSAVRSTVVLSKDRERDKGRTKGSGTEAGLSSNETLRISETKIQDGAVKCPKGPKRTPANLSQVLDQLLDIVMQFPTANSKEDSSSNSNAMEIDLPAMKMKGKSKVGEVKKTESESLPEKSAELGKVTFVLKLLGDILVMHSHAAGVILRRDAELCQLHGSSLLDDQLHGGIIHHVLHRVLPLSADKGAGNNGLRVKLFENASSFLAVLCGRSSEGRKRVVNELVNALSSYSSSGNRCVKSFLVPDCKILAFSEFVCSTLAKNS